MNNKLNIKEVIISALLISLGIIIPMFSPIKLILEPASYTLGSHVAIFIAMFISPVSAVLVALGTTAGFFMAGFPIVVAARALTHVIFATLGAMYIKKNKEKMKNIKTATVFSLIIGLIHGISEVLIVIPFYISTSLAPGYYDAGFLQGIMMLVGLGTVVHSMVDFVLGSYIWKLLPKGFVNSINKQQNEYQAQ